MIKYQRIIRPLILVIVAYYLCLGFYQHAAKRDAHKQCTAIYKRQCLSLYKRLRTTDKSRQFSPPTDRIPADLMDKFTQSGDMPLKKYAYINEAHDQTNPYFAQMQVKIAKSEIDEWRKKVRSEAALGYNTVLFEKVFREFGAGGLGAGNFLVVGTQSPWIEALALEMTAKSVVTVDFARKEYEQEDLKWYQLTDYLDLAIKHETFEEFTSAASYSFLEHVGLGRYGDQLAPDGDIDTLNQIHCLLKPDSLLFLGLQTSPNLNESYIEFNYQRVYGAKRLARLFGLKRWQVLFHEREAHNSHSLFVLKRKDVCAL